MFSRCSLARACASALKSSSSSRVLVQRKSFGLAATTNISSAANKLVSVLQNEASHEQKEYERASSITSFLSGNKEWSFEQKEGDVNMSLTKKVADKTIRVEWQLVSPYDPDMQENEQVNEEGVTESTDFCVSVENAEGAGITFFCSTNQEEQYRYVIGSCKSYASAAERDSNSAYNGPEFEDLDEGLQTAFDEYLGELGLGGPVFDFVDAMAKDKEQQEYIRWLTISKNFLGSQ